MQSKQFEVEYITDFLLTPGMDMYLPPDIICVVMEIALVSFMYSISRLARGTELSKTNRSCQIMACFEKVVDIWDMPFVTILYVEPSRIYLQSLL